MRISPWQSAFQRGSALVISIFFLLLLATLALTGLRASTTNVQIVGNMQARQEVTAAAQMLLEQTLSSDEFARNSQGVFAAARVEGDFNGDGVSDAVAVLAEPPRCLRARSVALVDLDPDNPQDAPCFASASLCGVFGCAVVNTPRVAPFLTRYGIISAHCRGRVGTGRRA